MSAPTVRVRIAVAVNAKGRYAAAGWISDCLDLYCGDETASEVALDSLDSDDPCAVHFVEADVPLPAPVTVEGEVQP